MPDRQDPFKGMIEPIEMLNVQVPALNQKPPKAGKIRPSVRNRRLRQVNVTFKDPTIPDRLRALALHWGWTAPDGVSPNTSAVVERLLLPALEAAEAALEEEK